VSSGHEHPLVSVEEYLFISQGLLGCGTVNLHHYESLKSHKNVLICWAISPAFFPILTGGGGSNVAMQII
jgi:hypothetical protein